MKIKKQKSLIIALSIAFVILLVLYFAVIRPLTAPVEDEYDYPDLLEGEYRVEAKVENVYIHRPLQRSEMQSIEVENEYGGYKIYRDASDNFKLDGNKGVTFEGEIFSSLVVSTGTPTAMMRADTAPTAEKLAEYGLDKPQAKWTVTTTNAEKFTILVGDRLLTEAGYYVQLEGRNVVYIVSSTLEETILQPATALLSTVLISGPTTNTYYDISDFQIWRGDDLAVRVNMKPTNEMVNPNAVVEYKLIYPRPDQTKTPGSYYTIEDSLMLEIAYSFAAFNADSVAAVNPTEAQLKEFGLDEPAYKVEFKFQDYNYGLYFSEIQDDFTHYVYSSLYGKTVVFKMSVVKVLWLHYDQVKWISNKPFYVYINRLDSLTIKGKNVDVDFRLEHGTDALGDPLLDITEVNSNTYIPNDEVDNFREFYKTLLNITNQEYATISDDDQNALLRDDSRLIMNMKYTDLNGNVTEYKFYQYYEASTGTVTTGKVFVVVNGIGEFYTTNDLVNKVLADIPRVLEGLDVDAYNGK